MTHTSLFQYNWLLEVYVVLLVENFISQKAPVVTKTPDEPLAYLQCWMSLLSTIPPLLVTISRPKNPVEAPHQSQRWSPEPHVDCSLSDHAHSPNTSPDLSQAALHSCLQDSGPQLKCQHFAKEEIYHDVFCQNQIPNSSWNSFLNKRSTRQSEVQAPTQVETLYSTTGHSRQKAKEELESKEQNTHTTKTNPEI